MTMVSKRIYRAIGLMSGTSLDGIDAALIETDGECVLTTGAWLTLHYDATFRTVLRLRRDMAALEREVTLRHAAAVIQLLDKAKLSAEDIDLIGFHGHTVLHQPELKKTWQIGDGALLAAETGISVVNDFRSHDVARGGQGAPLVPVFHAALVAGMDAPLAVVNIGGVANVTLIGADGALAACDTGPGNALINDCVQHFTGAAYDEGGAMAGRGTVDEAMLSRWLEDAYFAAPAPKSLDRDHFAAMLGEALTLIPKDAVATLTAFTARSIAMAMGEARQIIVCGGGRHNTTLMRMLREAAGVEVMDGDALGWQGDALEAQAFGFLAVRSELGLPLSFPGTTGVSAPCVGGALSGFRC